MIRAIITNCSDPMMWYANQIGKEISVFKDGSEYLTRDNGGFVNIVKSSDIQIYPKCKHQDFFDEDCRVMNEVLTQNKNKRL